MTCATPEESAPTNVGYGPCDLDRLIDAMLDIVAVHGWRPVSLDAVAIRAGVSPVDARALCADRAVLLNAFARRVDLAACADVEPGTDASTRYDELLDILMRRFEILQTHRDAMVHLIRDVPADPITLLHCLPAAQQSFARLASAAGYPDRGLAGVAMVKTLAAVWLVTQRDWLRDDTPDLSVTMASLDRNLRRAIDLLAPFIG